MPVRPVSRSPRPATSNGFGFPPGVKPLDIQVIGLNHRTAPVELREKLVFERPRIHPALRRLHRNDLTREGVLLSTCNRTELYFLPGDEMEEPTDAMRSLCEMHGGVTYREIDDYLYQHRGLRAAEHAFKVAGSLNSMVVGESQILGQVKDAYEIAREGGFCDKFLHQLFQDSFRVAKQIRTQTSINRLPTSVGSAAVALAKQIFGDLTDHDVLIVGSGKMGRLCLEHLNDSGVHSIGVLNRTEQKARRLAERFGGTAGPLDNIEEFLTRSDIVITSTGSDRPLIDRSTLESVVRHRGNRPLFLLDIAGPRDVGGNVRDIDHVYLYDIDDLETVVEKNLSYRETELNRAEAIVEKGVKQFDEWLKTQDMGPMIRALKQEVYQLVEKELREHLVSNQTPLEKHDVQLAAHRITNKLLDDPLNVMKEKAIEGETETIATVREMFDIDQEQIESA